MTLALIIISCNRLRSIQNLPYQQKGIFQKELRQPELRDSQRAELKTFAEMEQI